MARLTRFAGAVFLVVLTAGTAAGGGQGHKTPQQAFDALMAAVRKDDWKSACPCLTDESFTKASAGLVLIGMLTRDVLEKFAARDKQGKFKEALEALNGAFAKHNLTRQNVNRINFKVILDPKAQKDHAALAKVHAQLTEVVKDRCAFLDDLVKAVRKTPGKAGLKLILDGELADLKVEGETARGALVTRKGETEQRRPIGFRKVGGGWKVDVEPSFATPPAAARDEKRPAP